MKFRLLLCMMMIFGLSVQSQALPLLGNDSITINDATYFISNRYDGEPQNYSTEYYGYSGTSWSGYYIGTIQGNDSGPDDVPLVDVISYYLDTPFSFVTTNKVDAPDNTNGALTITYSADFKTGTWEISDSDQGKGVSFYTVKGANEFALYYLDPALTEGIWTTEHLLAQNLKNQPEISHLTVVYNDVAPVPEPATMILLGLGLVGFAGFGRKKIVTHA